MFLGHRLIFGAFPGVRDCWRGRLAGEPLPIPQVSARQARPCMPVSVRPCSLRQDSPSIGSPRPPLLPSAYSSREPWLRLAWHRQGLLLRWGHLWAWVGRPVGKGVRFNLTYFAPASAGLSNGVGGGRRAYSTSRRKNADNISGYLLYSVFHSLVKE